MKTLSKTGPFPLGTKSLRMESRRPGRHAPECASNDQQERTAAVLLLDVAVGKTPGDLLRAFSTLVNTRDEVNLEDSALVPARVRITGPAAI